MCCSCIRCDTNNCGGFLCLIVWFFTSWVLVQFLLFFVFLLWFLFFLKEFDFMDYDSFFFWFFRDAFSGFDEPHLCLAVYIVVVYLGCRLWYDAIMCLTDMVVSWLRRIFKLFPPRKGSDK